LRRFESLTLADDQFLPGDKNGRFITLAGQPRLPQGVQMSGLGGLSGDVLVDQSIPGFGPGGDL
jgi:hypothetical protein